jgi:Cytochrome c oxidase subunit IV
MTDEAAVLLRVAVFGVVSAVVYWFVSYEPLGTVALLLLGGGTGFAAAFLLVHRRRDAGASEQLGDALRRFAGIPPVDPVRREDYAAENVAVLPLPSIWPLVLSLGIAILTTGLVFGLWLIVLGLAVGAVGAGGWLAAINRENRYGRIEHPSDTDPHEADR